MQPVMKKFVGMGLMALGLQTAWGFALLGPNASGDAGTEPWQTIALGYDLPYESSGLPGGAVWLGDIGGPHNLGEEYRRNAPVLYYTCDANFLGFFGSNGVSAVDSAFAVLNGLTNVDSYSTALSEFPLGSQHFNYTAQSLYLTDLKSVTLHLVVEQMGLAEPERYTWTLHDRYTVSPPGCPLGTEYIVVQRNFDITDTPLNQIQYSPYVNNVLYTYSIVDDCDHHPPPYSGITVPFATDPDAEQYTAVAANDEEGFVDNVGGLQIGGFYTGLTRDDVAGLRYLLTTNNVNWETAAAGSILTSSSAGTTNFGLPFVLYTSNYTAFAQAALTNSPAVLSNLFPGLIITSSTNYPVVIHTPNIVAYYTNSFPLGNTPVLVLATNGYTDSVVLYYVDTFANLVIITNSYYQTNTSAQLVTVQVVPNESLGNGVVTNTTIQSITLTNVPTGDYYITTNPCGLNILYQLPYTNVVTTTNIIVTSSNSAGYPYSQSIVTYTTNHAYWVEPFICSGGGVVGVSNSTGLYQGIGNVQFVNAPYDSLIGQAFQPITNNYTMVVISGSKAQLQTFQRIVTQPDILLTASDQAAGPGAIPFIGTVVRSINYDSGNVLNGLRGPGVINSPSTFDYNKVGANFWNGPWPDTNAFILQSPVNETTQIPGVAWASFDGTTNDPVVYPNGTSIQNIENQILIQISPTTLPDGTNGVPYTFAYTNSAGAVYTNIFTTTGGAFTPPYTWSALGLPNALVLSTNGTLSGPLTNNVPGTYDLTIQMTDYLARSVTWSYSITIH
jgi:hypothetical protein